MSRPLSVFTYYARNKRKVGPLLLILALAVALMVMVQSLVSSARDTAFAIYGSYQKVEVVAPRVRTKTDAYVPISTALEQLKAERARLDAARLSVDTTGMGNLASVLDQLQQLPQKFEAAVPSTAPVKATLTRAGADGAQLQADLATLASQLRQAQARQAEQAQLAALAKEMQSKPNDPAPLIAYLNRRHDFTQLVDTTDYGAIAAQAERAGAGAGRLAGDLQQLQKQTDALAAVKAPPIPDLRGALPHLPAAADTLNGLSTQLAELQNQLEQVNGPPPQIDLVEARARAIPGVASVERDTYANIDLTMLAGDASFDLYGLDDAGMARVLRLYGDRVAAGRLPRRDAPEVAISEEVARARGIGIGGVVGSDVNELDSLPEHFTVVGLLAGPTRLGFIPRDYMTSNYFFSRRYQALLVIPEPGREEAIRAPLRKAIDQQPYRIFDGPFVAGKIDSLLVNLQRINDFLTLVVGGTLALVIALLNSLYFRQRMNEFGLLAALGYSRLSMARRVAVEGAVVVFGAWLLGALVGVGGLAWFNAAYIEPHGLVLRVFDPGIILRATLPVPALVLMVSLSTLFWQLRRLDPVAIIERRD